MITFTKLKKPFAMVICCLFISLVCFSSAAVASPSMTVSVDYPYGTKDDPAYEQSTPFVSFSYTGTPTHYNIVVVDEEMNILYNSDSLLPVEQDGDQIYYLPTDLPKNKKLGVSAILFEFSNGVVTVTQSPFQWFILQ